MTRALGAAVREGRAPALLSTPQRFFYTRPSTLFTHTHIRTHARSARLAQRKRRARAALEDAKATPLEAMLARADLEAALAEPPLAARAAKGAGVLVVGLAVNTAAPAALALLAPGWGAYLGCLFTSAITSSVPLDALAAAVLAFAGQ